MNEGRAAVAAAVAAGLSRPFDFRNVLAAAVGAVREQRALFFVGKSHTDDRCAELDLQQWPCGLGFVNARPFDAHGPKRLGVEIDAGGKGGKVPGGEGGNPGGVEVGLELDDGAVLEQAGQELAVVQMLLDGAQQCRRAAATPGNQKGTPCAA